ncbi:MAG TPA: GspL/Epsl periplasmic domain-containing protein [Nitrospirota bacterium]|nr:GspL/Epsl periplasmic domain-containing protein [Nitrospirota bacterium]
MKVVGLNIERGRLAVSIIEKSLHHSELKDSFCSTFATDAELVQILSEKAKDWTGARIISSIPGHYFSQRMMKFPFTDRARVEKALPFEIEDNVPFSLEDVILDHLVMNKPDKKIGQKNEASMLGIMLPKKILRRHLDLLSSAAVDPQVIVPSYAGLYFVSKMIPVETPTILIGGNNLCLKDGKTVKVCRSYSASSPTAGIRHLYKGLEAEVGITVDKAYLLTESDSVRAAFNDLGIAVEMIVPEFGGKKTADPVSLGIALCEDINFRKGEFAYRLTDANARKKKRTLIIAGAVAGLLALANVGVKFYLTQSNYGKLDGEIKAIYRQALPDSKLVGDPVEQLRRKLDESRKKFGVLGSGTSALDVMKIVTESIPKEIRVSFQEFLLEGDRLKLQGEAPTFESVDKIKTELQKAPPFAEVQVLDTRMGVDNKVKFRFDIKLKQTV